MTAKLNALGAWQDAHSGHGRAFFDVKIGAYYIYRCRCGSKFFVPESEHGKGRESAGLEKE